MTRAAWAAAAAVVAAVYALRLDRAAGLMVDDAWYITLAKALASGDGYRLISSATAAIVPVVPPGFPLVLAPIFVVSPQFPDNVLLLKAVSIAAMFGVGIAAYRYFVAHRGVPPWPAAAIATATVLTPAFVFLATSTVMAECVFTLAQVLAVVLLERSTARAASTGGGREAALAGLAAAGAMLVRTAGVAMVVAGVLVLVRERAWRRAAAFGAAAALGVMPWQLYAVANAPTAADVAAHGGTIAYRYADLLEMRRPGDAAAGRIGLGDLPRRVAQNAVNVFARDIGGVFVPALFRGPSESGEEVVALGGSSGLPASMGSAAGTMAVSLVISAVIALGWLASLRRRVTAAEALVAISIGMILLVPSRTFRYVLPLAPFLWLYFVQGLSRVRLPGVEASAIGRIAMACLLILQVQEHLLYVRLKAAASPPPEWLSDAREVDDLLQWMDGTLLGNPGAVASTNPGLVYLRTGRKGMTIGSLSADQARWQAGGVRYLAALRPVGAPSRSRFTRIYESPSGRLWIVELPEGVR
jgi:hypothetical protein